MRLVCPNCDAKYEVPEDAIPETGRDVQCANCGHAWFQMRPRAAEAAPVAATMAAPVVPPPAPAPAPAPAPVVEAPAPAPVEPELEPEPEPVTSVPAEVAVEAQPVADDLAADVPAVPVDDAAPAEPEVAQPVAEAAADVTAETAAAADPVIEEATVVETTSAAPDADESGAAAEAVAEAVDAPVADPVVQADAAQDGAADVSTGAAEDAVDAPASTGAIAAAGVAAYAVDESVLAILREEAEREAHARKSEAAKPLETQTDLGLDTAMPAPRREPGAMPSDLVSGDETPEDRLAVRRTRLPDVEEINSTLRPSETADTEAEAAAMAPAAEGRSSFRSGFLLVMTLAILASALYGSADAIAAAVPALAGPLKGFVSFIDSLRLHLDGLMQSATVAINGN